MGVENKSSRNRGDLHRQAVLEREHIGNLGGRNSELRANLGRNDEDSHSLRSKSLLNPRAAVKGLAHCSFMASADL